MTKVLAIGTLLFLAASSGATDQLPKDVHALSKSDETARHPSYSGYSSGGGGGGYGGGGGGGGYAGGGGGGGGGYGGNYAGSGGHETYSSGGGGYATASYGGGGGGDMTTGLLVALGAIIVLLSLASVAFPLFASKGHGGGGHGHGHEGGGGHGGGHGKGHSYRSYNIASVAEKVLNAIETAYETYSQHKN